MAGEIIHGDCLEVMRGMDADSVDAVVTDPPYGLRFMGKHWDHGIPGEAFWVEALRVAKPGAHLLAFGGTRTYHRLACAIEDAGWEIRDCVMWVYGAGFPKSLDVSKAIDKAAGVEREVVGINQSAIRNPKRNTTWTGDVWGDNGANITAPATPEAAQWEGWGTALKPAWEPVLLCRKPLGERTVAANVLKWGVGALNIDGCRIETSADDTKGRWPANLIHDGSEEVLAGLGEAARFFYCSKASRKERNMGLDGFVLGPPPASARSKPAKGRKNALGNPRANHHPTVKPVALMRYLCRLITPPGGTILDPFAGSGSTGIAAIQEGFAFVGIEKDAEYCEIARKRIAAATPAQVQTTLFEEVR